MPRDNQTKMSNKELIKSKKMENANRKKHKNEESSDDDISLYTDDDDDELVDVHEYRKFLKNIFPSKHLDKKIKAGESIKKLINSEEEESSAKKQNKKIIKKSKKQKQEEETSQEEDKEFLKKSSKKQNKKIIKKSKKQKQEEESSEEEEESAEEEEESAEEEEESAEEEEEYEEESSEEESSEEESSEEEEEYEELLKKSSKKQNKKIIKKSKKQKQEEESSEEEDKKTKSGKFNIIFTIDGREEEEDEDDDDDEWESCSDTQTENEDDPISSDSDKEDEEKVTTKRRNQMNKLNNTKNDKSDSEKQLIKSNDIDECNVILTQLNDMLSKHPNDKSIQKCIQVYETDMKKENIKHEKRIKKEKNRNGRIFRKILRDKNTMNDFEFYEKLDLEQQKKIIKELREINKITRIEKPYRLTLLDCNIPVVFKASAMKKISSLRYMEPGSGEYYKIKNWVDTFMRIPFSEYKTLPISIDDGIDNCHDFMANAQKTLDDAVYGLNDAKMQIMQMLGQLITNPKAIGSAIAIHGPPGTGKTSLVKEGISKILNRPFAFIALGGATDSSFLEGHGYTYEGSTWGKIVQILIDSKCMNPVIYFDELDKISDTPKGEEIAGILTHLTDTSQNTQFHDKYFTEIDFDLSKCLFIFSYNDESKVNPVLKDRMYRIQTMGYNQKQKTVISNNYLLPKIREQVKFTPEDIIIPEQTIHYIIENYCNKEDGIRNLKRCIEVIYTKLNLYRLMRQDSNLFEQDMSIKVSFPFTVTKDIVDKLIKKTDNVNTSLYMLYC
jgi:ATP-dependent Lon protease